MANRKKITDQALFEVFSSSARRCCLCFALEGDFGQKPGQVAHIDQDPANNAVDNLAWLCLNHHDAYDSKTSQTKGYTVVEVKEYRARLVDRVKAWQLQQTHTEPDAAFVAKRELIENNRGLFLFAAWGSEDAETRKIALEEVKDPDWRGELVNAWNFLDRLAKDRGKKLDRGDIMAREISSGEQGKEDLFELMRFGSLWLSTLPEEVKNEMLFKLNSDTLRSGLLLLDSGIRKRRKSRNNEDGV